MATNEPETGNPATRWTGLPNHALLWEPWGEDFVIYNTRSGETHFINATAARILKLLQEGPSSVPDMAEPLRAEIGGGDVPNLCSEISRIIRDFDQLGLVRPEPR
jgi:PqqD family protein of HPr-rel-A system